MGKKSRLKRKRREGSVGDADPLMWMGDDGMHAIGVGQPLSLFETAAMTEDYQQRIRNSPLWNKMVKELGEQKATELLKEFKVRIDEVP